MCQGWPHHYSVKGGWLEVSRTQTCLRKHYHVVTLCDNAYVNRSGYETRLEVTPLHVARDMLNMRRYYSNAATWHSSQQSWTEQLVTEIHISVLPCFLRATRCLHTTLLQTCQFADHHDDRASIGIVSGRYVDAAGWSYHSKFRLLLQNCLIHQVASLLSLPAFSSSPLCARELWQVPVICECMRTVSGCSANCARRLRIFSVAFKLPVLRLRPRPLPPFPLGAPFFGSRCYYFGIMMYVQLRNYALF